MKCGPGLVLALCALSVAGGPRAHVRADEPLPPTNVLRYRRVLVPQERIADYTRGYLPMERTAFQSLLTQIEVQHQSWLADAVWIRSAEYQAVFSEGQLVAGQAVLQITHMAEKPTVLSLAPCSLAIGAATWRRADSTEPAAAGMDEHGDLLTWVTASGDLHFPWTLRGVPGEWGECRFEISLAAAPLNRLTIDLPSDLVLSADRGVVTPPDSLPDTAGTAPAGSNGLQRWSLQLGGHHQCRLTVAPRQADHRRQQLVNVQQDTTYRLMDDGLEVECNVELSIHRAPLNELVFEVDPALQITVVRLGNLDVNWVSSADDEGRSQTVRVRFDERLTGVHPTLQLFAVGPLQTGGMWRLPTLRPQDVFWRQGTMSLIVPESLELQHLSVHNARQAAVAAPQDGLAGEITRFELFAADGALEVSVARQGRDIVAEMGTTIDIDPGTITSQTLVDLRSRFGQRFVIEARVPNAWTIDGIEAPLANSMNDYQFVAYEADHKRLQIQLAQPLDPDQSIRLAIRAHRTPSSWLAAEDFRPVEFLDVAQASRLVAIAPDANYRLDLVGDDQLDRVDPDGLSPADAGRLRPRQGGVVFVDNDQADRLTINIMREDPEYAAVVHVDVEVNQNVLAESYRIECTPDSTPVSQLRLHLSETRPVPLTWQFAGGENAILDARRLTGEQQAPASLQRTGETWEITLRTPQATPFEIRGKLQSEFETVFTVALATLPAAVSHEGRVTIHSLDGTRLSIKAHAARSVPCEPAPPGRYATAVAGYQYDASHNARIIVDRAQQRGGPSPLWAWQCLVTTQHLETGRATHVATFLLESAGGTALQFRLPGEGELRGLAINGADVTRALRRAEDGFHAVTLPEGQRFPRVELTYETAGPPLGIWSRLAIEFPQVNVPVLDRRWRLWLPPGYLPSAGDDHVLGASDVLVGWKQRLLGPFAARVDERPFRLFSAEDWLTSWEQWGGQPMRAPQAEAFLQSLGELLRATEVEPGRLGWSWQELFAAYVPRARARRIATTVWVDSVWLAAEGFKLETAVPPSQEVTPIDAALSVLAAAHLVVVEAGDQLFLTSQSGLARNPLAFVASRHPNVVTVRGDSPWADALKALPDRSLPGVIPLSAWVMPLSTPGLPWPGCRNDLRAGVLGRTWRICEIRVSDSGRGDVKIEHSDSVSVVGWSVLLVTIGIIGGWGRQLGSYSYGIFLMAAGLALLAPAGLVPITSSLLLGVLLGLAIAWRRTFAPSGGKVIALCEGPPLSAPVATTAVVLVVAALLVWSVRIVRADPWQRDVQAESTDSSYQVVVPVDANLAPVGQYDYLPLEFYDAVILRARESQGSHRDWLVTRATYRGVFNWRQQGSLLDLTTITATYQLNLLQSVTRLEFPWEGHSEGVELLEARLDGQPIELNWNAQRTSISIQPPSAGFHQLELVLRPSIREEPGERGLRFSVLPVACAHMQIEVPFGAPEIRVPSAFGSWTIDPETGVHHAELGPVKQVELRWRPGTVEAVVPRPTDVQQLMWLKVRPKDQPDSVVLDVVFRIQAIGRQVDEVTLRVDSRLQLLPEQQPAYEYVEEPAADSGDRLITVRWREAGRRDPELHLQFHLTNTTGLGNVSLPRVEFVDGRVTRRWLAVSVSPDLEFVPGSSDLFTPLDPAEFLTVWGEAESAPNSCYRVSAEDPGWSLATRSRQSRSESRQSVDISVDREKLEVVLDADLVTSNGEVFQHRLSVPREFQVETIAVTAGDSDVAKAVHHDGSGTVTVFLRRGLVGAHRLSLRGYQPVALDAEQVPLPSVSLVDATIVSHAVRIYRKVNVLVEVQTPTDLKPLSQIPLGSFREPWGRLVSAFEMNVAGITSSGGVNLQLHANEPRLDVRLVTTLRRVHDKWEALADFNARVASESGGLIDQFRFEIPPEWTGPFSVEPDVPYEIRTIPGQRPHLVVWPWQPVADQFDLRIGGVLQLGPTERGRTPNIVPLDASSAERFFVLPTQLDQQRIDWETPGLVEVPLRDAVPDGMADPTSHVAYRVWAKPRAVIADVQHVAGERQISLADVYFDCRTGQQCFGVVSFTMEPAGTANCTLQVPANLELVQASVDGVPASMVPLADRRWHVRLTSEQLPQQLTIVFRGSLPRPIDDQSQSVAVPWIVDLNVVRTLWTIRGPAGGSLAGEEVARHRIGSVRQETLRLRNTAEVVASAAETVLDRPLEDIQAWYAPWAVRLACAGARISQQRWLDNRSDRRQSAETAEVDTIFQDHEAIAQRLKVSPTVRDYLRRTHRYPESRDLWDFGGRGATVLTHYAFLGQMPGLRLAWRVAPDEPWWPYLLSAVVLLLLAGGLRLFALRRCLSLWRQQWPYAVGVLGGIVWWLLASPSLLGWVIVAVSLWGAIRWPFVPQPLPRANMENGLDATSEEA
ncbi:MAG: hypothetical protein ACYC4U_07465 [Pirellulaceae bacterium]